VTAFELPTNLIDVMREDDERHPWVAALPDVVADLAKRWSLSVGAPFQPGGECSWVAPVRASAGQRLVLKVGWQHPEARDEAAGLHEWAGRGAVRVHATQAFGETNALLLERCLPGTTLRERPEPEQDTVVAALLPRLWSAEPAADAFRPLQVMCDQWADGFEAKLACRKLDTDPGIVRAGLELWRALPATSERHVLLATDLHAGNILAAQREPWLVIDPKPYVGDPSYDALQHMLNCMQRLSTDPIAFARRLAELLQLDADRLLLWLFARCIVESFDNPALRDVAAKIAPR
jgi:streptomycin 6-kinase